MSLGLVLTMPSMPNSWRSLPCITRDDQLAFCVVLEQGLQAGSMPCIGSCLRLRQALLSTIHQQKFLELESVKKQSVRGAIQDIEDKKFWKCLYILLRCVFPALRALRFCDASRPVMDKIFFLSHRTTEAIIRSQDVLNDPNLFGALKSDRNLNSAEGNVILGGESDDDDGEDVVFEVTLQPSGDEADGDEEESDAEEAVKTMSFGKAILDHWNRRKTKVEHAYSITAWTLCVMKEIREDVRLRMIGTLVMQLEK